MSRKLIIDGNAVYEIDEECMLRKRIRTGEEEKNREEKYKNRTGGPDKRDRI